MSRAALGGRLPSSISRSWSLTVRAATFAASIVVVGAYLAVAAIFAFTPTWIGLGVLAIALVAAVTMVVAGERTGSSRQPAS